MGEKQLKMQIKLLFNSNFDLDNLKDKMLYFVPHDRTTRCGQLRILKCSNFTFDYINLELFHASIRILLVYKADRMVLCVVLGCSKRSGRDKDISLFRLPRIINSRGEEVYSLN